MRENSRLGSLGKIASEATRAKLRLINPPERLSFINLGKPKSPEHCAKMSKLRKGKLWSEERKLTIRGKPWTKARWLAEEKIRERRSVKKQGLLIESYSKFNETHTKYFKSPCLHLDRYGFHNLGSQFRYKLEEKPRSYLKTMVKLHEIKSGHIVYRWTTASFGEPVLEIWYNKEILDKYGNKVTPQQERKIK
jgi:hypothetical protein